MGLVELTRDLNRRRQSLIERQGALLQPRFQRLALQVVHDQEGRALLFPYVIERANVRVIELGDRPSFAVEAFAELRIRCERLRQDPDRDNAIEARDARCVDLAGSVLVLS